MSARRAEVSCAAIACSWAMITFIETGSSSAAERKARNASSSAANRDETLISQPARRIR